MSRDPQVFTHSFLGVRILIGHSGVAFLVVFAVEFAVTVSSHLMQVCCRRAATIPIPSERSCSRVNWYFCTGQDIVALEVPSDSVPVMIGIVTNAKSVTVE